MSGAHGGTVILDDLDPGIVAGVVTAFGRMAVLELMGARLSAIGRGRCDIDLPFRADLTQQHGFLHAGVVSTIADSAGGFAAFSMMPPEKSVLAVEFKINLMRPSIGRWFRAVGRVLKPGRTLTICEIDVYAFNTDWSSAPDLQATDLQATDLAGAGKLCARVQQTCMAVDQQR